MMSKAEMPKETKQIQSPDVIPQHPEVSVSVSAEKQEGPESVELKKFIALNSSNNVNSLFLDLYTGRLKRGYFLKKEKLHLAEQIMMLFNLMGETPVIKKMATGEEERKRENPKMRVVDRSITIVSSKMMVSVSFASPTSAASLQVLYDSGAISEEILEKHIDAVLLDQSLPWSIRPAKSPEIVPVYNILATAKGLQAIPFGMKPLLFKNISDNYSDTSIKTGVGSTRQLLTDVITGFNPKIGRMVLMHGPPGTGKTFFVKSLFTHFRKLKYTLCSISSPSAFVQSMDFYLKLTAENTRCVFFFEDAVQLLDTSKEVYNTDAFSALLNTTDGLVSSEREDMFIFTFNRDINENIHPAFLRPGRLFKVVPFTNLTEAEAKNFLESNHPSKDKEPEQIQLILDQAKKDDHERYNLSELFTHIRGATKQDTTSLKKATREIGFH